MAVLFLAVLYGMQLAEQGIQRIKGDNEQLAEVWNASERKEGDTPSGKKIDSHDLEKKKERLEELKVYNVFAEMGKALARALNRAAETLLQKIASLL